MPSLTLGTQIACILQFIVVIAILNSVLTYKTSTGMTVFGPGTFDAGGNFIPTNYLVHLNGTSNSLQQAYISSKNKSSFYLALQNQANTSAGSLSSPNVLTSLGGLAFLPSAFGQFMSSMLNVPNTISSFQTSIFTNTGVIVLPLVMAVISGALLAYVVIVDVAALFGIITKTQPLDI